MSYLVLARKHRPQTFKEVIGQDHIADLLIKAIESNRVAHAYLFSGPRGVGKTSCARILAKCLNCAKGPTLSPCGECSACQEIAKGTSFDVLEIDGASNRGIDEIRALRENVKFAPSYGRYKIYIVDEVHMLTTEAFNALLKTLEEPPEHVKFIFATTSPNKVPATIISRCQRFDFVRIPIKTVVELLAAISQKEGFKISHEALYAIAKAAQGSFRDALSILDQLGALSDRAIEANDVFSMLGLVETQLLFDLSEALGKKNCTLALETLEKITDKGKDVKQLMRDLIEHFRNLMVIKVGGKTLGKLVDYPVAIKEMYLTQCDLFSLKDILNAIDTFVGAQEIARITESLRMPLEIAFAKLTYQNEPVNEVKTTASTAVQVTQPKPNPPAPAANSYSPMNVLRNQKGQVDISGSEPEPIKEVIAPPAENFVKNLDIDKIRQIWDTLTHAVSKEKMSVATYLQEGIPSTLEGTKLTISFPPESSFNKNALEDQNHKRLIERVLSEKLNAAMVINLTIGDKLKSPEEDDVVKNALNTFQGKVVNRWHNE